VKKVQALQAKLNSALDSNLKECFNGKLDGFLSHGLKNALHF
jgi:hypothetical protein